LSTPRVERSDGGARELIVLDRDGVINHDSDEYIKSPAEWIGYPRSIEAIAQLSAAGFEIVVATNQSGLGRGLFDGATLDAIHAKMIDVIEAAGGRIASIYVCPHRPDEGCDCRKPAPGLLRRIEADFGTMLSGVPVVGDKASDMRAAMAVGARPMLVLSGRGREAALAAEASGWEVVDDLAAAAAVLLAERS
jgi:D-glycero-D-manno-heptose 1,7-bisphosphate phosphatase